jgi:histidinol-phosphatase (PHP family)
VSEHVRVPWKVSLHGGHSGAYCDHARGSLRDVLEAAVAQGFHTYGVTEHAPRLGDPYLYREEQALGWDVPKLEAMFEQYAAEIDLLAAEFEGRLCVLKGFEAEVVPPERYVDVMVGYRKRYGFDYMVGSVHFVDGVLIDGPQDLFEQAVRRHNGLEGLAVAYYRLLGQMADSLKPEVVGHFDLIRKNAPSEEAVATPLVREAAALAMEAVRKADAVLDLNTAGYRKGLGRPYPAPWVIELARRAGVGFCFGDDSHGPHDVGRDLEPARDYLLANGVQHVEVLTREQGRMVKRRVAL